LSVEGPGAVLAAAPLFNGKKYYSTAIANTDSYVLFIETQDVHNLCREHADLLWSLAVVFAHRVRHYAELIETLALRNVDQRVAQYLLSLCGRQGNIEGDACTVEITITQAEMASRIGSTREVVCRSLAHLEGDGLIQSRGPRVVHILSVKALGNFAGVHHDLEEARVVSELSAEIA
jgi:CRP-like cAMP-binding protein